MTLFKICSQNFDPSLKMALVNWGILAPYGHKEKILKKSSLKLQVRFEIVSQKYVPLVNLSKKIVRKILIRHETWPCSNGWEVGGGKATCTRRT